MLQEVLQRVSPTRAGWCTLAVLGARDTVDESISFGDWLRRRRSALGLTREALGRRVGLSVAAIRKLESDERRPSRETADRLAEEFGISSGDRGTFVRVARSELRVEALPPPLLLGDRAPEAKDGLSFQPRQTLPTPLTSFVGRDGLIEWIESTLLEDVRLLTLTGPGGVGKTRLALEVARRATDHFSDGVWFVDLSPIVDPGLVLPAVARVLGLAEIPGRPILESLKGRLQDARALLVLDNFEQVAGAASLVAELLAACPRLTALVTSRALLRVSGERHVPVPPLRAPGVDEQPDAESLLRYDAVRLFMERAGALDPDVVLPGPNAPVVAEICRRLEGLPLALELAAARSTMLSLPEMLSRLEDRLGLLTGGARDLPERQRTMRATIEWSHDLLEEEEERLYRRLGVFAGGFTLEAAESVCGDGEPGIRVLEVLGTLVDHSLVRRDAGDRTATRYLMLETVREYAVERLEESGEAEDIRRRHADYYLATAEAFVAEVDRGLVGPHRDEWLSALRGEYDNLRTALGRYTSRGEAERALRLASALGPLWLEDGPVSEGMEWLRRALGTPGAAASPARWVALWDFVWMLWQVGDEEAAHDYVEGELARDREQGNEAAVADDLACLARMAELRREYALASALGEESAALYRAAGNRRGLCWVLATTGRVADELGDHERARRIYEEALALARESGDVLSISRALWHLGWAALYHGDVERGTELFGESLALNLKFGARRHTRSDLGALGGLGFTALVQGDYPLAAARFEETLAQTRDRSREGPSMGLALYLRLSGWAECYAGNVPRARRLFGEALAVSRELGDERGIPAALEGLAGVAAAGGDPRGAARIFGAAEGVRAAIHAPADPAERLLRARCLESVRGALGQDAFEEEHSEGRAMPRDEDLADGMRVIRDPGV